MTHRPNRSSNITSSSTRVATPGRSGPALSRYFTGLRAGRIVGVRTADGRVMVPPTEYDPITGAALDEYVEVGPGRRRSTAWTWVAEPVAGKHHLTKPFAFALVRPDGADVADGARRRRRARPTR